MSAQFTSSSLQSTAIAFIGAGNMAEAIIEGAVQGGSVSKEQIQIYELNAQRRDHWTSKGYAHVYEAPSAELSKAKIWVLAVKPQVMKEAIDNCREFLQADTLVVSIAVGIQSKTLEEWLGSAQQPHRKVIRTMPNTPIMVGKGVVGLYANLEVDKAELETARDIFRPCAKTIIADDEQQLNAITVISGSGPAYVFQFLEGMIKAGQEMGFDEKTASELALQTAAGAVQLAQNADVPVETLRKNVTSKGGTTAAAIEVFHERDLNQLVVDAIKASRRRIDELTQEISAGNN